MSKLVVAALVAALSIPAAFGAGFGVSALTTPEPPTPTVEAVVEVEQLAPLDSLGERWMYVITSGQNKGEVMDAAAALVFSVPPGRFVVQKCETYSDSTVSPPLGSRVISTCDFRRVTPKQVVKHYEASAARGHATGTPALES